MSVADWQSDSFGLKPVELISPMSIEACQAKLRETIDDPMTVFGKQPVIGRVEGSRLNARKRIYYKNALQTWLVADLSERHGETRISCRFSMQPIVLAFAATGLVIAALMATAIFVFSVLSLLGIITVPIRPPQAVWFGLLVPPVMPVIGWALVRLALYLAKGERAFLIDFLLARLAAQPTGEERPAG